MDIPEFLRALADAETSEDNDIYMEFAGLCGKSDAGKNSKVNPPCKEHGHLSLSVDKATFYDVVAKNTHVPVLLVVPRITIKKILEPRT